MKCNEISGQSSTIPTMLLTDAVARATTERVEELSLAGPVTACVRQLRLDGQGNDESRETYRASG